MQTTTSIALLCLALLAVSTIAAPAAAPPQPADTPADAAIAKEESSESSDDSDDDDGNTGGGSVPCANPLPQRTIAIKFDIQFAQSPFEISVADPQLSYQRRVLGLDDAGVQQYLIDAFTFYATRFGIVGPFNIPTPFPGIFMNAQGFVIAPLTFPEGTAYIVADSAQPSKTFQGCAPALNVGTLAAQKLTDTPAFYGGSYAAEFQAVNGVPPPMIKDDLILASNAFEFYAGDNKRQLVVDGNSRVPFRSTLDGKVIIGDASVVSTVDVKPGRALPVGTTGDALGAIEFGVSGDPAAPIQFSEVLTFVFN